MRKDLLLTLSVLLFSITGKAQSIIYDGTPYDSVTVNFDTADISDFVTDTSALWDIGSTGKTYFSSGGFTNRAMMTDTFNSYPIDANACFIITLPQTFSFNPIISFTHKYQMDAGKDGGIVEFSNDGGMNWQNVKGDCNMDTAITGPGILTQNVYGFDDTLENGERAFTGESNTWIYSRIQFYQGIPVKSTASCDMENIMVRFRFVSDGTAENMDGWIISGLTIEQDMYTSVKDVQKRTSLEVYPNPSADGRFYFPELNGEYNTEIINSFGQTVYKNIYQRSIDMSSYAKGLYFYKVTGGCELYTGQLIVE